MQEMTSYKDRIQTITYSGTLIANTEILIKSVSGALALKQSLKFAVTKVSGDGDVQAIIRWKNKSGGTLMDEILGDEVSIAGNVNSGQSNIVGDNFDILLKEIVGSDVVANAIFRIE